MESRGSSTDRWPLHNDAPVVSHIIRVDLPLLLPGVEELRDACVSRLVSLLEERDGVESVHVIGPGEAPEENADDVQLGSVTVQETARLCLHYDPERLTLAQVRDIVARAGAELTERFAHVVVPFRLVGTEDDGRRLEHGLLALSGVTAASVNLAAQSARIEFDRTFVSLPAVEQRLRQLGARTGADAALRAATTPALRQWLASNRELVWSLTAGFLLLMGWLVERSRGIDPLALLFYIGSYAFGARDNIGHFLKDVRRGRFAFNIDLLMVVAAAGAALLGHWSDGALLLFLFSLGHALEHYALARARGAIKALSELSPRVATVIHDGAERLVPIAQVRAGDQVVVKPAERIAVDGTVTAGRSNVNQAPITGESVPVDKAPGDPVFAGSVNGNAVLTISVTAAIGDRTLDRVIELVAEAQTKKAPTQQFTERFEQVFVPVVLVADVLLMTIPPLLGVWSWSDAFYRAMTLLVAASPCALALGTPAAVLAGIAEAARNGVLMKGGTYIETLGVIRVIALDKTGTITEGEPRVTDVVPGTGSSQDELLAVAAAVEARSQHPLARAIVHEARRRNLSIPTVADVEAITGFGIRSTLGDSTIDIGRLAMFEDTAIAELPSTPVPQAVRDAVHHLEAAGRTTMIVRRTRRAAEDTDWLGVIAVSDEPRPTARRTIEQLRAAGIARVVMLTGDNQEVGDAVGASVGVDEVRARLLPVDKVDAIRELAAHGSVAMVGDGVNDAPALAHSTVGIAMGGAGTAAALETADVVLMSDDISQLPFAIALSRRTRAVIRQNLAVSLLVIAGLVVTSVLGVVGIGVAIVLHEGSTLAVIGNALRLLSFSRRNR
ncbi:MAG: Cadmium-transporting ATPase [Gemmatimonadaceae bacterium]|nr:Cadmium-transporting ATPase [Gemmatimonadaceae bacterium]